MNLKLHKGIPKDSRSIETKTETGLRAYLPELGSDLVTALAGLKVDDLSHGCNESAEN